MTSQPLFITFEGIDGSGKTTLAETIANLIPNTIYTREPLPLRPQILEKLQSGATQSELLPLFLEDRRIHLQETIEPALAAGKTVICDRYSDSTIAYQALDDSYMFSELCDAMTEFRTPDLTFLIHISPMVALNRMSNRSSLSMFEELKTLSKISQNFTKLYMKNRNRIHPILNDKTPADTISKILLILAAKGVLK